MTHEEAGRKAWRCAVPFYRRCWLAFLDRVRPLPITRYPVHTDCNFAGKDGMPFFEVDAPEGV